MTDATGGRDSADATTATTPPPPTGDPFELAYPDSAPPIDGPREIRPPSSLKPAWVLTTIAAAVLADVALRIVPWDQLGMSLLTTVSAIGLAASGFVRARSARLMLGLAVLFAIFLTWRTGFLLSTFNLLSAVGLLTAGAVFGRDGDAWNTGPARLARGVVSVLEGLLFVPIAGFEEAEARYHARNTDGSDTARAVIRGLVIAVPVVLVLGLLLASADVVFESFFTAYDLRLDNLFGHLFLLAIGAAVMVALLRVASGPDIAEFRSPDWRLGVVESSVLLGSITALFAAFAYAQILTVVGGADKALTRAGLGPAQFARQGFFQLLWVAGITLVIVMTVWVLAGRADDGNRIVKALGLVTVALTLVIVAVALTRIMFYIDDSGLTARRLYAGVISIWIAISFVLVAARLLGAGKERSWLTPALVLSAIALLLGLNLANPQKRIAENNLARNEQTLMSHIEFGQFRGDGRATLADNLDRLSPELAAKVEIELCRRYGTTDSDREDPGPFGFNLGRSRADDAIDRLCG